MTDTNTPASVVELFTDAVVRDILSAKDVASGRARIKKAIECAALASQPTPNAEQPRDDVRELLNQPTEAGSFVGDIFYGSDDHTTMGTHRWDGGSWVPLMDQTEALIELLRMARQERDRLRDRIDAALSQTKMLMSQEWLDKKIATDPDDAECEAGPDMVSDSVVEVQPNVLLDRFNQLLAQRENADTCTTYSGKIQEIGALFCDNRRTVRKALAAQPSDDDVIEQCAKVADNYARTQREAGAMGSFEAADIAEHIAQAIRALADKGDA